MKKKLKILSLFCRASLHIHSVVFSNSLRGRLEKFGTLGLLPASFVNITLSKNGKNLKTMITGSDGAYYFGDIEPGLYILKIWVKGFDREPLTHEAKVLEDQQVTDADRILVHRFIFEFPEEQVIPSIDLLQLIARGSYYALPEDVRIWPILKCKNGNYLISTEKPVLVGKDGKWKSKIILIDRPVEEIIAVLVTKEGDNYFRFLMLNNNPEEFNQLPENSCILAKRRIKFD